MTSRLRGLLYWSTVFMEGEGVGAKLRLLPNTLARVVYYATGYSRRLVTRSAPDVVMHNRNGKFRCRKGSDDLQVVAAGSERGLTGHLQRISSGVFVDIGANIGRYTVMVARQLEDRGRVIAIEADPENVALLRENVVRNGLSNVQVIHAACCDRDGEVVFYMQAIEEKVGSSLCPGPGTAVTVPGVALDTVLRQLDLHTVSAVKIDVEGAEPGVLRGMQQLLRAAGPIEVYFEAWDAERLENCSRILETYGLRVDRMPIDQFMYRATKGAASGASA